MLEAPAHNFIVTNISGVSVGVRPRLLNQLWTNNMSSVRQFLNRNPSKIYSRKNFELLEFTFESKRFCSYNPLLFPQTLWNLVCHLASQCCILASRYCIVAYALVFRPNQERHICILYPSTHILSDWTERSWMNVSTEKIKCEYA